ncbi:MAG: hypothetical protein LBT17_00885 [Mycoplasmataceae bacterium]|jgi:hypothetical protein|nr:hypothetical protein [Mycoplasmataceae bacterium]
MIHKKFVKLDLDVVDLSNVLTRSFKDNFDSVYVLETKPEIINITFQRLGARDIDKLNRLLRVGK